MSTLETVILGIVSSLIATFVFLGLAWVLKNAVLPWLEDKIYRGVRIDGRWKIRFVEQENGESFGIVDLKQKGDRLCGTFTHESDDKTEVTTYSIAGSIANSYTNISLTPASSTSIDTGSLVAHIYYEGGLQMSGVLVYISTKDGRVESAAAALTHADS